MKFKNTLTLSLTALLCATLILSSCKKKKDDPAPADNSSAAISQLAGHSYSLTAFTSKLNGAAATDEYAKLESCLKDNFTTFNADFTTTEDEGATKCDPADDQVITDTWLISNNGSTLIYGDEAYTILENNGTVLKISLTQTSGPSTAEIVLTLTKI
jgi:hypothetical protein